MNFLNKSLYLIIRDINYICKNDIIIVDNNGYIVESTDKSLINSFNGAASEVIKKELDKLVVYDNYTYENSDKGIYMQVKLKKELCGVVGIIGSPSEVTKYGEMVKKIAEVLILEQFLLENEDTKEEEIFILDWVFETEEKSLLERGLSLGIDIRKIWRILLIETEEKIAENSNIVLTNIGNTIKDLLKGYENIYAVNNNNLILLVQDISDEEAIKAANKIRKVIFEKYEKYILIGIDKETSYISNSYKKAKLSLECATEKNPIVIYEQLHLEIFTANIEKEIKEEFIKKIFKNCSSIEIEKTLEFLKPFFESGGSVAKMSKNNEIHKNTVNYRLKTIYEKTDVDPRTRTGYSLFLIANIFYSSINYEIYENL